MAASSCRERADRFNEFRVKNTKIIRYLNSGLYVDGLTDVQKRVVRCQAKNYSYDEARGELYYTGNKPNIKKKVVMQEDEVLDLLKYYHSSVTGGHSGINATLSKISTYYTWKGIKQDVVEFIKACDRCQRCDKPKTQAPELKVLKTSEPLELVGMDLTGPLPTTEEGFQYVLTFTDYYTKFVEFFPLKSKDAAGMASCIQTFVWRWGAPKRLLSDLGQEFVAKINADLCKKLGIDHSVTSACHPQTKGLGKRSNQTLRVRLSKLVNDHQTDWADYLDGVAFSIRTQKHASTKYTPFFLMFGRHPRTVLEMEPADNEVTPPLSDEMDIEETDKAVSKREELMAATNSEVRRNIEASQSKQNKASQRRKLKGIQTFQFSIGDSVNRGRCKNVGRKGGKMEPPLTAPYRYRGQEKRQSNEDTLNQSRPSCRENTTGEQSTSG